jgi:hypothetical protein
MLTHIEVHSATSYHVVLAGFGEILVDMYALNINSYTLPTTTCPLALLLVSQSNGLVFLTPVERGFDTRYKTTTIWKAS